MVISQIFKTGYFSQSLWENFMAQYGGSSFLTGSFFYFELLFNISIIVVSIFLIVLMNQKRVTFPRLFIWFRVVVLAGFLFDTVISNVYLHVEITNFSEIAREVMGVAIWVPYMAMSERVKKTFVNTYKKSALEEEVKSIL
jgi:ABC-type multidrug transport system permease subunit